MPAGGHAGTAYVDFKADLSSLQKEVRAGVAPLTSRFSQLGRAANASTGGIRRASTATKDFDSHSRRLGESLKGAAKYAAAAAGAYIGISQISGAISATETLAKTTISLNRNLGFSIKSASELGATLQARGVDTKKASQAFSTFASQVRSARDGSAAAATNFKALGISQEDLKNSSPEEMLNKVSDGLHNLGRGFDRTDISKKLFGRGWQDLSPILREGSASLKEQMDLANKYGASFSGKTIQGPKDLIKAQRELKIAQLGLQIQFTRDIAPALIAVGRAMAGAINAFRNASPAIKGVAIAVGIIALAFVSIPAAIAAAAVALVVIYTRSEAVRNVINALGNAIKVGAVAAFDALKTAVIDAGNWISTAASNVAGFVSALWPVKIAVAIVAAEFRVAIAVMRPWMTVLGALAGLVGSAFSGAFRSASAVVQGFGTAFGNVIGIVSNLLRGDFSGAWRNAKQLVTGVIHSIVDVARTNFGAIKGVVKSAASVVGSAFMAPIRAVKGAFNSILGTVRSVVGKIPGILSGIFGSAGDIVGNIGEGIKNWINDNTAFGNSIDVGPVSIDIPKLAVGGKVMAPMAIVGEEAPNHPEYVLATNPAYRQRNMGLWAQAGSDLGVPGFATGGIVGASTYGGPGSGLGTTGAYGNLAGKMAFAELGMGHLLGGLAPHSKLRITRGKRSVVGEKLDIGAGGAAVGGHKRAIDLWYQTAHALGIPNSWLGLVKVSQPGAPTPSVRTGRGKGTNKAKGLGIPGLQKQIDTTTSAADVDAEYADRSDSLGIPIKGFDQLYWLQQELRELFRLRALLIQALAKLREALSHLGGTVKGAGGGSGGPSVNPKLAKMIDFARGVASKHFPYVYGGGHGGFGGPYDCSGFVSAILHAGGFLGSPITTDGLKTFGASGAGHDVSIGVRGSSGRSAHTMIKLGSTFFESGGGHGAAKVSGWDGDFPIKRHPPGLKKGGIIPFDKRLLDPRDPRFVGWGLFKGGKLPGFKTGAGPKKTSKAASNATAAIKKQRQAITQKISDTTSTLTDIQGIGSSMGPGPFNLGDLGGRILDVQKSIRDYGGDPGGNAGPKGFSVDDLKSIMALKGLGVTFNPDQFAGVFHQGGVVPGPHGREQHAVVKGGEGYFTREQMAALAPAGSAPTEWHFYLGDKEITDLVRVEQRKKDREDQLAHRAGAVR